MAFLISGFLKIAMESITGNSEYNCSNKNKINSKASGGRTPNGVKIRLIKMNPNNGGIYTPKSERKSVKKVMFAFRSRFLCSMFSRVPEDMIWLRILFALMSSIMYITMGTTLPIISPSAMNNVVCV